MPKWDKTERLLNLVFAMMSTRRAISRADIRDNVAGYEDASSDEAFERMFERDKDELRSMGLPIETVTDPMGDILGYRISAIDYEFVDLELSSQDIIVLGVAAQVWDEAVLRTPAQNALRKIEAKYGQSAVNPPTELSGLVRLQAQDISLPTLLSAARDRRVVTFDYQSRSGEHTKRTLEPWAVLCRNGNWYCIGFDRDRGEQRTFKLPRINSAVRITSQNHTAPRPSEITMELPESESVITAEITITANRGAMLRRHATSIRTTELGDHISIQGPLQVLTEWTLLTLGDVVSIESPPLKDSVRAAAERILRGHVISAEPQRDGVTHD